MEPVNLSCPKLSGRLDRLLSDKSRCCSHCNDVNSSQNSSSAFPDASSHSRRVRTPIPSNDWSSALLASWRRRRFDKRQSRSGSCSMLLCDKSSDVSIRSDVTAGGNSSRFRWERWSSVRQRACSASPILQSINQSISFTSTTSNNKKHT